MGILRNGILGTITGKVSGVVGSTWKGRNTLRAYAKPGNPNTAGQQTQRGLFSFVVNIASLVLGTVITDYWNPFATSISGFNEFVKRNLLAISSNTDYAGLIMSRGNLEGASITSATNVVGEISMVFPETISGNGLLTDTAIGVIVDSANNIAYMSDGSATRDDEALTVTTAAGCLSTNAHAYLFFFRGSGSSLIVSNSSYHTVADA